MAMRILNCFGADLKHSASMRNGLCLCRAQLQKKVLMSNKNCIQWRKFTAANQLSTQNLQRQWKVLFFGTDDISIKTLDVLHKNSSQIQEKALVTRLEVVCPPDRKAGRKQHLQPSATKQYCVAHDIPFHQTPVGRSLKDWSLPSNDFDIAVVVSFGYFLPKRIIDAFPCAPINMHPSKLPKYRGPAPIHHTLMNGDDTTAVSIIELHREAFDKGRILYQQEYPVEGTDNYQSLADRLAVLGAKAIVHVLRNYDEMIAKGVLQDESLASHAPKITSKDERIIWERSNREIKNLWRAIGANPGCYTHFEGKRVKILELGQAHDLAPCLSSDSPGSIAYDAKRQQLIVKCGKGCLSISKLQVESKRPSTAADFANGYQLRNRAHSAFT